MKRYANEWDHLLSEKYDEYLDSDRIIKLKDGVLMYLPYIEYKKKIIRGDYIQRIIFQSSSYYEEADLNYLCNFLAKEYSGSEKLNICDIGANIGNHTLFFANRIKAKHVYSFEPVESTFSILEKNIRINKLDNVSLFNMALGKIQGRGSVNIRKQDNCGANQIIPDETGKTKIATLDDLEFCEKIDFVKIDVEGFEKDVIQGGKRFFSDNSPVIYVEIFEDKFDDVNELLAQYGYKEVWTYGHNYLYTK